MKITYFNHRRFGESDIVQGAKDIPTPYKTDLDNVISAIRDGVWGSQVQKCRSLLQSCGKKAYSQAKALLPVIMPCGIFTGQDMASMTSTTNLMILDFDDFPCSIDEVNRLSNIVKQDPYTYVSFVSISGLGLKVLVKLDQDIDNDSHHQYFQGLKDYYKKNHPELFLYWDESSKNINRLCYISHDPEIYVNPDSLIWSEKVDYPPANNNTPATTHFVCDNYGTEKVITFLEGGWDKFYPMIDGHRHDSSFHRAKELAEWGIAKEDTLLYFEQFLAEANDPADIKKQIDNAYEKAIFGSKRRKL